ncbi:MAG: methyltransferase domain-containing protein [Nevskia sp.]|nr:methyltransferase domain-containing protein [Nevskia sp.]
MSERQGGNISMHGSAASHEALIRDQFSRQAELFARSPELHGDAQIRLLVEAARPRPGDAALDVACGPGTVVAAFAARVRLAAGLDATEAMLEQARALARERGLSNVEWQAGDVYRLPFADAAFDIVSCRFAIHHFQDPAAAVAEMARVCRPGGRIVLCDGVASSDPAKAAAFNAMERHRDPSTAEFRTLRFLAGLFTGAGLPPPEVVPFQVAYERERMIAQSFPVDDDRGRLRQMIDGLIAGDAMDVGSVAGGITFIYPAAVLAATRP